MIQNTGTGRNGAFDVKFNDTLPADFVIPGGGLNLSVTDGTGAAYLVTDLGGGLFNAGLELTSPSTIAPYDPSGGQNVVIVTYDLQVGPTVGPNQTSVNTASLTNYAAVAGGPNFLPVDLTDPASVTVMNAAVSKSITATDRAFTPGTNLAIGEVATYNVVITIPQGVTASATLVDTLPDGLAIVDLISLTPSDPLVITASAGTFDQILSAATVTAGGSAQRSHSAISQTPIRTPRALKASPRSTASWLSTSARTSTTAASPTRRSSPSPAARHKVRGQPPSLCRKCRWPRPSTIPWPPRATWSRTP